MASNNKKTWLSHSGIDVLYRCPRCFWLKYNKKLSQPEGITSRLPGRFDIVIKRYFDKFRFNSEIPPIIEGKLIGKLENPFQEKYFCSINDKYGFWGKLDECLIGSDGLYSPVDFKTSSSDPRGRSSFEAYQHQIDEFSFLLEQNGKKTSGMGYLIYFYPDNSEELHKGFPMIVHIDPLKANSQSVLPRIMKAIEVLEGNIPEPSQNCSFCHWREELSKILE